jgi:Myb-like DNA-binding protein FlbD
MNRRRRLVLRRRTSQCPNTFDERPEPLSFARPAAFGNRPLIITSTFSPSRRALDTPLPSPSSSDVSRAESVDGAPSLVSDTGSTFSISPRVATSPAIELPPLNSLRGADVRRSSLPVLHFRPNTFLSEADNQAHAFATRFHGDSKVYGTSTLSSPTYRRPEQYHVATDQPRDYHEPQAQLLTAPSTPVQLPPLQISRSSTEQPAERDSRMHLSSLLV